jgi:asparagine synthase (glutamine-hydrolysing)
MVSGGLDSSSVAAVAAEQMREEGRTLHAFHAAPRSGFDGPVRGGRIGDESADVEAIARMHPNMDLRVRRPDGRTPFDDIETSFRMTGGPPRNPGNVAWFDGIYAAAGAEGIRVLLAGHKGNATISYTGMRALREAARRGRWHRVYREVKALARATGRGRKKLLVDEVLSPLAPSVLARLWQRPGGPHTPTLWDATGSAVNRKFARTMQVEDRVRAARLDGFNARRAGELAYRVLILRGGADVLDTYSGFRPEFGVETRDPTGDLRVVEYCFAIPGFQYLRNGVTRWLIRRAMEGRLPDRVRERNTIGAQSADWTEWLPPMRKELEAELTLLERSETANRCLDLGRLRSLFDRWPEPMGSGHEKEYYHLLLRGLMMGRFIRWFEATYG